jgi:ABC-type multidrug transport system fused ATPase/permease subunit
MSATAVGTRDVAAPSLGDAIRYGARALRLVWNESPRLTANAAILTPIVALLPAAATYLGKLIVDGVIAAAASGVAADRTAVLYWLGLEAVVVVALLAGRRVLRLVKSLLHAELGYGVSRAILDKAMVLDLGHLEDPAVQEKFLLARQHATSRPFGLVNRIFEHVQYAVTLTALCALLWTFSGWAVALVVLGGLPLFAGEVRFSGRAFRFYKGRTPEMRERSYLESLLTSDTAAIERIHHGSGGEIRRRYADLFTSLYGRDRSLQSRRAGAAIALSTISSVVFFGTKAWIVWEAMFAAISLGQMTMLIGVVKQGRGAVTALLAATSGMYEDLLYVSNLYEVLDLRETRLTNPPTVGTRPGDGLRLERVSFTYPRGSRPAIAELSIHVPPGTSLGIVGANGSGKSTLVKLLAGLYPPQTGQVLLDGTEVTRWDPAALRQRMAAMFQPFARYKMTVADNIAMGDGLRTTDPGALSEAAERGLAAPLIAELPDGLATRLSRRFLDGRELSGGQWQRLALARTLLRDQADVLILDEPTSAMDAAAEAELLSRRFAADRQRTLVLVSHRLANLRTADRIIVLDDGRVVECGTHADLIDAGGVYARLFALQAEAYRN